jgi:hypothetical protein
MIKLTDILKEIKTNLNEISDSKYSSYWLDYGDKNSKGEYQNSTPVMGGYLKVVDFISKHNIKDYTLYGRRYDTKTFSNVYELIATVENGVLKK